MKSPGLGYEDAANRTDKWLRILDLPRSSPEGRLPEYVWDLVNWNERGAVADSMGMKPSVDIPAGPFYLVNPDNLFLGTDVQLSPGVVLNASSGPIMIARGVRIGANSVIEGPCYLGEFSIIAPLTHIGPGTTLGPGCRIGGAVANSIVMGFTDKPFEGYLGDSYVGRWCTLGRWHDHRQHQSHARSGRCAHRNPDDRNRPANDGFDPRRPHQNLDQHAASAPAVMSAIFDPCRCGARAGVRAELFVLDR